MSMNLWVCEFPGCCEKAVGVGSAKGLRAVGWWFRRGEALLCPYHRPDPIECSANPNNTKPCPNCAAEREAAFLQSNIPENPDGDG